MAPVMGARCVSCEHELNSRKLTILKCYNFNKCGSWIHRNCFGYPADQINVINCQSGTLQWFCATCSSNTENLENEAEQCYEQPTRVVIELRNIYTSAESCPNLSKEEQQLLVHLLKKSTAKKQDAETQTCQTCQPAPEKHRTKVFREMKEIDEEEEEIEEDVASMNIENNLEFLHATVATSEPLKVIVERAQRFYDTAIDNNVRYYDTRSKNRGNVLIINNYDFKEESYRNGALVDQKNLIDLFTQMGFNISLHENCTAQVMRDVIEDFTKYEPEKECDICFAFVMSHGKEENNETFISGIDDIEVRSSWIESRFNNYNCRLYRNKPKILLYQVCRGVVLDIIEQVPQTPSEPSSPLALTPSEPSTPEPVLHRELNRSYEDMLIGHSTMLGYKAHRDRNRGTWYIELICSEFMKHAHNTHIEELLKKVDNGLRYRISEEHCSVQTSTFTNHGFHNCYIHPGIYEEDNLIKQFDVVF